MSLATRLLGANPGVQVSNALTGSLTTPGAKQNFVYPVNAYESIQTITVSGTAQSITFSSIPSTYKDLEIRYISRDTYTNTAPGLQMLINGAAWTSVTNLGGGGSGAPTSGGAGSGGYAYIGNSIGNNLSANLYAVGVMRFFDYSNTNKVKTWNNFTGWQNQSTGSSQDC